MAQIDRKTSTEGWIRHIVGSIDEHLDEETKVKMMVSCGQACARSGPVHVAREFQGNLGRWLATLRKWRGGGGGGGDERANHLTADNDPVELMPWVRTGVLFQTAVICAVGNREF